MSTVNSSTSVQDLVATLLNNFDSNKDGQVSTDEFSSFLTRLLSGVNGANGYVGTSLGASAASTAAPTTAIGTSAVKFEGFDFAAVKDPAKSAKYAFASAAKKAGTMPTSKTDAETPDSWGPLDMFWPRSLVFPCLAILLLLNSRDVGP